jgi:hypothetical protein
MRPSGDPLRISAAGNRFVAPLSSFVGLVGLAALLPPSPISRFHPAAPGNAP